MGSDRKEYLRQYYQTHKEQYREASKKWKKAHPEYVKKHNHQQYLRRKALKQKGADTDSAV